MMGTVNLISKQLTTVNATDVRMSSVCFVMVIVRVDLNANGTICSLPAPSGKKQQVLKQQFASQFKTTTESHNVMNW